MTKCPVCDWEIKDQGVPVETDGKIVVVCCQECAEALQKRNTTPPAE